MEVPEYLFEQDEVCFSCWMKHKCRLNSPKPVFLIFRACVPRFYSLIANLRWIYTCDYYWFIVTKKHVCSDDVNHTYPSLISSFNKLSSTSNSLNSSEPNVSPWFTVTHASTSRFNNSAIVNLPVLIQNQEILPENSVWNVPASQSPWLIIVFNSRTPHWSLQMRNCKALLQALLFLLCFCRNEFLLDTHNERRFRNGLMILAITTVQILDQSWQTEIWRWVVLSPLGFPTLCLFGFPAQMLVTERDEVPYVPSVPTRVVLIVSQQLLKFYNV